MASKCRPCGYEKCTKTGPKSQTKYWKNSGVINMYPITNSSPSILSNGRKWTTEAQPGLTRFYRRVALTSGMTSFTLQTCSCAQQPNWMHTWLTISCQVRYQQYIQTLFTHVMKPWHTGLNRKDKVYYNLSPRNNTRPIAEALRYIALEWPLASHAHILHQIIPPLLCAHLIL